MEWKKVLEEDIQLKVLTKTLPTKGNLVYEYNPLRNYRLTKNMYEYKDSLYSLYDLYNIYDILIDLHVTETENGYDAHLSEGEKMLCKYTALSGTINYVAVDPNETIDISYTVITNEMLPEEIEYCYNGTNNASLDSFEAALIECRYEDWQENEALATETLPELREAGELVDFINDELTFSLNYPVTIVPQYSYDGSVNLILNDGLNIPRLINTRFSATGRNTYEIVDRRGDNDTNIYDQGEQFDIDTSLYKRTTKMPKLVFGGVVVGGNLAVGAYHFYFKYADADGNETDFVAESGLVSVFIGYNHPTAVQTGISDENSCKMVKFYLSNIDASYSYVHVYFSRSTAQPGENAEVNYGRVDKNYIVNNAQVCNILITGFEEVIDVSSADINMQYNVVDAAYSAATCSNMLMLANVHRPEIPYDELRDLSLRFLPYLKEVVYPLSMTYDYAITSKSQGYYDPDFIYSSVGYWGDEYYRFGVVYIMPNNELSPVFNIRGRMDVGVFGAVEVPDIESSFYGSTVNDGQYNYYKVYAENEDGVVERSHITMNEETYYVLDPEDSNSGEVAIDRNYYENAKGVVKFSPKHDTDIIYAVDIRVDDDTIQELKKYVKGFFFVRQKRMPTILCQGITIGVDINSYLPTIPTAGGFLTSIADSLDEATYVEVDDITAVNYISEGFMSRYHFKLTKKKASIWKTLGKIIAGLAILAVMAVTTVFSCGVAAGAWVWIIFAVAGCMSAAAAITSTAVAGAQSHKRKKERNKWTLQGRDTPIPTGMERTEYSDSRVLTGEFLDRIIIADPGFNNIRAILCPDYEGEQAYYNQLFTGNTHVVRTTLTQSINRLSWYLTDEEETDGEDTDGEDADEEIELEITTGMTDFFTNDERHFYIPSYYDTDKRTSYECQIQGVPDDVPLVGIGSHKFRARAGYAEEAWRYESMMQDWDGDDKKINAEIVRGSFGPYLAMTGYPKNPCDTVEIMIPGYEKTTVEEYVAMRIDDSSEFFAVSDRFAMEDMDDNLIVPLSRINGFEDRSCGYAWDVYRGDCYLCQVTHRLNRNFNDPTAPYNDEIIDADTWKDNYNPNKPDKYNDINAGDVNAVKLGMWVTFRIRSSSNLNIRTVDSSNIEEKLMCGHGRGFYPYLPLDADGVYKTPETEVYNPGFKKSVSERYNYAELDVPALKNWFGTRIMYSDIHVNDAFKNGFRVFKGTNYIDCPRTYGEITKIMEDSGSIVVIFEHGIGIISVSEKNVASDVTSGHDYLNINNVLSEPVIISTWLGSQWQESIIQTTADEELGGNAIYGVDTVAKKIWMLRQTSVTVISDEIVERFLIENITLGEREMTPIIGIRNVKTCYNAFKHDVMFTFYDNLSGFEENVWNLCYNEKLKQFITFYSWVPSYMENINNIPFSFNRNTSKWIAKLGVSHAENSFADGITLTNNIMENAWDGRHTATDAVSFKADIMLSDTATLETVTLKPGDEATEDTWKVTDSEYRRGLVGILGVTGVNLPSGEDIIYKVDYSLERDNFLNYNYFEIKEIGYYTHQYHNSYATQNEVAAINDVVIPVYGLYLKEDVSVESLATEMYYRNIAGNSYADWESNKAKVGDIVNGEVLTMNNVIIDNLPIYKNRAGKRLTLDYDDMINATFIVRLLNIKASIYGYYGGMDQNVSEYFYNYARENASSDNEALSTEEVETVNNTGTTGQWVDCGYYESVVAVIPRWNMQFLSTDFWKHGQAGLIDIADKIYPAYWYGEQHPFEFEFIVVDDKASHKIFQNLEIISNNVQPESFHFEIIGDAYDFSKDKVNMYFRQEAMKALYQYNGADILYNDNFLEMQPSQNKVSADFPHNYYAREDTFNDIYDVYKSKTAKNRDYDHMTGSEVVYDENTGEYGIWMHQKAVSLDDEKGDSTSKRMDNNEWVYPADGMEDARSLIAGNCRYIEDKWYVVINPIVVTYKNEYNLNASRGDLRKTQTTWTSPDRPPLPVMNSPLPEDRDGNGIIASGTLSDDDFPECLKEIGYTCEDLDGDSWLDDVSIHGYNWGEGQNREEVDVRDKFVKVRIRYKGDNLVLIRVVNTIYEQSIK